MTILEFLIFGRRVTGEQIVLCFQRQVFVSLKAVLPLFQSSPVGVLAAVDSDCNFLPALHISPDLVGVHWDKGEAAGCAGDATEAVIAAGAEWNNFGPSRLLLCQPSYLGCQTLLLEQSLLFSRVVAVVFSEPFQNIAHCANGEFR